MAASLVCDSLLLLLFLLSWCSIVLCFSAMAYVIALFLFLLPFTSGQASSNYVVSGSPAYGGDPDIYVSRAQMNHQTGAYTNGAGPDILGYFNALIDWWY